MCPHSLRGLHATLALEGGATADAVARALGHGSFSMTARHYASESSVDNAKATKVSSLLGGHEPIEAPKASGPDPDQILGLLKSLPAQQLAELLSKVSRTAE